jgi:hypothetical protein
MKPNFNLSTFLSAGLLAVVLIALTVVGSLTAQEKPKDNWERTKACAAQAEKVARENEYALIQNHYSPKYEKCYMHVSYIVEWGYRAVIDAFEQKYLTLESMGKDKRSCWVYELGAKQVPCPVLEDYVSDHLDH